MNSNELSKKSNAAGLVLNKTLQHYLGILIFVSAFLLYSRSISFEYTYDDPTVSYNNTLVSQGISGIPKLLATDFWFGVKNFQHRVPEYRPVPLILSAI